MEEPTGIGLNKEVSHSSSWLAFQIKVERTQIERKRKKENAYVRRKCIICCVVWLL